MTPHSTKKQNKDRSETRTDAENTTSVVTFKVTGKMFYIYQCSLHREMFKATDVLTAPRFTSTEALPATKHM